MLSNDLKVRIRHMAKSHLFADLCRWFADEKESALSDLCAASDLTLVFRAQGRVDALTGLVLTLEELRRSEDEDAPTQDNVFIPTPVGDPRPGSA